MHKVHMPVPGMEGTWVGSECSYNWTMESKDIRENSMKGIAKDTGETYQCWEGAGPLLGCRVRYRVMGR